MGTPNADSDQPWKTQQPNIILEETLPGSLQPTERASLPHTEDPSMPLLPKGATQSSRHPFLPTIPAILLGNCQRWATHFRNVGQGTGLGGGITEGTLLLTRRAPPSHGRARKETVPLGRAQVLSPLLLQQSFQFKIITFPIKTSKGTGPGSQSHQRFSSILLPPKAFLRSPLPSEQV